MDEICQNMKVVIISHHYPNKWFLSSGTYVHEQVKELKKLGVTPYVIRPIPFSFWFTKLLNKKWEKYTLMPNSDIVDEIKVFYPRYISYPKFPIYTESKRYYKSLRNSIKEIISDIGKIDLIHAHFVIPDGFAASLIGIELSVPTVVTAHGSDVNMFNIYNAKQQKQFDQAIKKSSAIISVSRALQNKIEQYGSPQYIETIPIGVNTSLFAPEDNSLEIRKKLGIPENVNVLLFVGYVVKAKGIFDLLKALQVLKEKGLKNIILIIIGVANSYKELLSNIKSMNLDENVMIIREIPHDEVKYWMSASDVLILPSYSEGLPTVIVEAMACGLAVIATPVGGVPEILIDDNNGIIVPVKEPNILAEKIEFIINNPDKKRKYGLNARKTVVEQYDVRSNAQRIFSLYKKLI